MKSHLFFLISLLFLLTQSISASSADPCVFDASPASFYSADQVAQCFATIPFSASVRDATLKVLSQAMQFYAFLDIASDPPDPQHFSPPVPLLQSFEALSNLSFPNDFLFHHAVRSIYLQLHDAHTNYYYPASYASFAWYQPFNLVSFVDPSSGDQSFVVSRYVDAGLSAYYLAQHGLSLRSLVGAKVLAIDDQQPLPYLRAFALRDVGLSKDPGVRFNLALNMPGPYASLFHPAGSGNWLGLLTSRLSHYMPFSPFDARPVRWILQLPNSTQTIAHSFPWVARTSQGYASSADFLQNWAFQEPDYSQCPTYIPQPDLAGCGTDVVDPGENSVNYNKKSITLPNHPNVIDLLSSSSSPSSSSIPIYPIANSTAADMGMWMLGNDTLVWYLGTFEPDDCGDFKDVILAGFSFAQTRQLSRLLIDTTGNGGGYFCLARSVLSWLFPDSPNWGPTDMPSSPAALNMTSTAVKYDIQYTQWSPAFYQDESGAQLPENAPIPFDVPHARGGLLRNYSQLIHVSADSEKCGYLPESPPYSFSPENMLIVNQGFCGSSCALFAMHLHNYHNVSTVSMGGPLPLSDQQQYASFPGLEVLETPCWYQTLDQLLQDPDDADCGSCTAPRQLPTSAGYRFCNREIYGPLVEGQTPPAPLEYTWSPATHRRFFSSAMQAEYPQLIWSDLLQYFPTK